MHGQPPAIIVLAAAEAMAMAIPWRCASRPPDRQPVRARHNPSGPLEQTGGTHWLLCVCDEVDPRYLLHIPHYLNVSYHGNPKKNNRCGVVSIRIKIKTSTWNKFEGLLPLFWGPALHIPFKKICNPSKRKGQFPVNPSK